MKKILFVKLGALGDLSYALPAAKALKELLDCELTWVVGKSFHHVIKHHSYIDKLIVIDDKKIYSNNKWDKIVESLKLFLKLHQRYDSVLIAHRDAMYHRVFKWFSRGSVFQLVRENKNNDPHFVVVPPLTTHESLAIKKLVEAAVFHYQPNIRTLDWQWDYSHIKNSPIVLPPQAIVLHLGGGVNTKTEFRLKRWVHWEEFVLKLLTETKYNLVFVGSTAEESEYKLIAEKIAQDMPGEQQRCLNLMGTLTIPELIDVIRRCNYFVGVDSGPLHFADSLNKKALGIYGPTSSVSWGLLSPQARALHHAVPCSPCYRDDGFFPECHFQHQCMQGLQAEHVFAAFNNL